MGTPSIIPGTVVTVSEWHYEAGNGQLIGTGTLHRIDHGAYPNTDKQDFWVTDAGVWLDATKVMPATNADREAWTAAYMISWIGASNPSGVALTIHESICKLRRAGHNDPGRHDAVRAMTAHLDFLVGNGLGAPMDMLEKVRDTYRQGYCQIIPTDHGIDAQGNDASIPTADRFDPPASEHSHECRDCRASIPCNDDPCSWDGSNDGCDCAEGKVFDTDDLSYGMP